MLSHSPTDEAQVREDAKKSIKAAQRAVEEKLRVFQQSVASARRLAALSRRRGDRDFGQLFCARGEESLRVWQIFLSSFKASLGDVVSEDALRQSDHVKDTAEARRILDKRAQASLCKPSRVSHACRTDGNKLFQGDEEVRGFSSFAGVSHRLQNILQKGRRISRAQVRDAVAGVTTRAQALAAVRQHVRTEARLAVGSLSQFWDR